MHIDKAKKIASSIQHDVKHFGFAPKADHSRKASVRDGLQQSNDEISLFDALISEQVLRTTTRQLFVDGHYALAVEEAYKCLNNVVKSRSGSTNDGANLMRTVFSVANPHLKLNALKTDSQKNQQQGYMDIFAGCMTGIRNPRAHEHRYLDDKRNALELLMLANHLLKMLYSSKRSRRQRSRMP